jgi:uncharacterized protein (TIGR02996 family)
MLHTHDDFLKAIAAQPADRTLRLVFADWLDEHNYPNGALVRIEEEMRQLPVYSDRFWELKPRRNELRTQAGTKWCEEMYYGTQCEPVFCHGIPDGWRERWRLIREFTERWHRIPIPDVGGRQAEIADVEAQLGRKLPPSVCEWIALAHDAQQASTQKGNTFWNPYVNEGSYYSNLSNRDHAIILRTDDEFYWGIRYIDSHITDPPVYLMSSGHPSDQACSEQPTAETLTGDEIESLNSSLWMHDRLGAVVENTNQLRQQLTDACGAPQRFANAYLFEADNLFVTVEPADWNYAVRLNVWVVKGIKRERVPGFLWDYVRERALGTWGTGIFETQ